MRKIFIITAVIITVAIAIGSLVSIKDVITIKVSNLDKGIHLLAYFILSFNWFLTLTQKSKTFKNTCIIGVLVTIYGIIIEVLQSVITTYRQADYLDFIANSLGVLFAIVVFNQLFIKKQPN